MDGYRPWRVTVQNKCEQKFPGNSNLMPLLVAFTGFKGSGKDTAAAVLLNDYRYTKMAFGDPIKDALVAGLGLDHSQVHGDRKESPIGWLDGITPRFLMQQLGTEWGREIVHPDLWVRIIERRIQQAWSTGQSRRCFALTDVRHVNEIDMARQLGATIIHVRRGQESWWRRLLRRLRSHGSEQALPVLPGDFVVQNDGTVEDLHRRVLAACYGRTEEGVERERRR